MTKSHCHREKSATIAAKRLNIQNNHKQIYCVTQNNYYAVTLHNVVNNGIF